MKVRCYFQTAIYFFQCFLQNAENQFGYSIIIARCLQFTLDGRRADDVTQIDAKMAVVDRSRWSLVDMAVRSLCRSIFSNHAATSNACGAEGGY